MSRTCHKSPAGIEDEAVSREIASYSSCAVKCVIIIRCKIYFGIFFSFAAYANSKYIFAPKDLWYVTTLHCIRPIRVHPNITQISSKYQCVTGYIFKQTQHEQVLCMNLYIHIKNIVNSIANTYRFR